jgi:hypothetical protein
MKVAIFVLVRHSNIRQLFNCRCQLSRMKVTKMQGFTWRCCANTSSWRRFRHVYGYSWHLGPSVETLLGPGPWQQLTPWRHIQSSKKLFWPILGWYYAKQGKVPAVPRKVWRIERSKHGRPLFEIRGTHKLFETPDEWDGDIGSVEVPFWTTCTARTVDRTD